jgi:hypothetical protein
VKKIEAKASSDAKSVLSSLVELTWLITGAAECQDPVFLIGPRNKKTGKKRPTIKSLYPPVQIASLHFR